MPRKPHPAAIATARRLIADLNIQRPSEIDIELIAAHHNLLVRPLPLKHEEGRLLRAGRCGIINVAERAYTSEKWRFVIAHELGHFLRHPTLDNYAACTRGDLSNYAGTGRESEANNFASELLMPQALFLPRCDINQPSLHDIGAIATDFRTSLTSTTLRFVGMTEEPCAVVHSTNGYIDWADWSDDFKVSIQRGAKLDGQCDAGNLHSGKTTEAEPGFVEADVWGEPQRDGLELLEHSRLLLPGVVLTLLWHASEDS